MKKNLKKKLEYKLFKLCNLQGCKETNYILFFYLFLHLFLSLFVKDNL